MCYNCVYSAMLHCNLYTIPIRFSQACAVWILILSFSLNITHMQHGFIMFDFLSVKPQLLTGVWISVASAVRELGFVCFRTWAIVLSFRMGLVELVWFRMWVRWCGITALRSVLKSYSQMEDCKSSKLGSVMHISATKVNSQLKPF